MQVTYLTELSHGQWCHFLILSLNMTGDCACTRQRVLHLHASSIWLQCRAAPQQRVLNLGCTREQFCWSDETWHLMLGWFFPDFDLQVCLLSPLVPDSPVHLIKTKHVLEAAYSVLAPSHSTLMKFITLYVWLPCQLCELNTYVVTSDFALLIFFGGVAPTIAVHLWIPAESSGRKQCWLLGCAVLLTCVTA